MRYSALFLSAFVLSASVSPAQTGFSTKTYPAVLSSPNDNVRLLTADLNGDGRSDLVAYGSRYTGTSLINVFLNNGSGGFLPPAALAGSASAFDVKVGDMNGDGYPDIVSCKNIGSGPTQAVSVTVYLNNGTGGFTAQPAVTGNGQCFSLALGDVFQNGHLDVVTGGYTPGQYDPSGKFFPGNTNFINVFSNNGTGTLSYKGTSSASLDDAATSNIYTNCGAVDVVGADFLQDGKFTLIVTSNCQAPNARSLVGTTFLVTETTDQYGNEFYTNYKHLQSAQMIYLNGKVYDVNGDGKPDVLFPGTDSSHSHLVYFQNQGNGNFTSTDLFANSSNSAATLPGVTVGDLNGDGINDIATTYNTEASNTPTLTIFNGMKSGSLTTSQSFATGPANNLSADVVSADFNGDGKPDLATLVYDSNTRTTSLNVYTNTQSGSSNACSAPTTANTNKICSPASGTTVNSPVTVNAASNITGFTLNRLYLDNNSVYQTTSQTVSTPINAANGPHRLVLVSYNNKNQAFTSAVSFTVGAGTGNGCIPSTPGVSICSPANGSTDTPPVTIDAGAMAQNGTITAIRVYIDNNAEFTVNNPSASKTFSIHRPAQDFGEGTHHMVVVAYESTGGALTASISFTEPSGPCKTVTPGTQVRICSPNPSGPLNSPVILNAGASAGSGYITAMRAYIDNKAVATYSNPQQTAMFYVHQSLAIPSGTHYFVLVAYTSTGRTTSAAEYLNIR